jgi:peroxiredoxin
MLVAGIVAGTFWTMPAGALDIGQKAPDFTLPGSGGVPVGLADLTARGPVVVYTFIQAFTVSWTAEILGFEAAVPQFEAVGAQVVGVSADHPDTLRAFVKQTGVRHLLLADFLRQVLPALDALVTDETSPIYRYARRAYFVIDRQGIVRYVKVQENHLDLLNPIEVLQVVRSILGSWTRRSAARWGNRGCGFPKPLKASSWLSRISGTDD